MADPSARAERLRAFFSRRRWRAATAGAAEARLQAVLDALPEGVVVLDAEGRYVHWNEAYAGIYHRSADLFAPGARLMDTLRVGIERGDYPDAVGREAEWLAERQAWLDNPGRRHEQRIADGRWLMIEERRTADGGTIGLRVDITDMKRQAAELEAALRRAEAASSAKDEFLANMSHEIRTPLNGVLGLAEVLRRTSLDPMQRDLVGVIVSSAGALNQILADVLDLSRLEAGRIEIESRPFDLGELLRETAALFAPTARGKGLALACEIAPDVQRRVVGDPTRLKQILANLLSNAVKFTEAGSVTLSADRAARGEVRFEVADTGIGFTPTEAARLFERFQQADGSITRRFGGTGLGLSICRQLVELMGGRIAAAGSPGEGACFTLLLPLAEAPVAAPTDAQTAATAPGVKVLVADDNPTNRRVAEMILSAAGAQVIAVEDGAEAVRAFEAQAFDVILMDLQMPRMDGLTAIRAIRRQEAATGAGRIPIVVLSANVMAEHRSASAEAGADDHLGKPFRAEELIEAVIRAAEAGAENLRMGECDQASPSQDVVAPALGLAGTGRLRQG
ncbi:ATP-binding protein [Phenylobacterium montanum]|uniref:histidine kinase n=1 Tax=Phenylobacterium montanum TaxID=2823693 RepID=A0A975FXE9_9CAUL|nr:ATP-binding protein [Caulobacter sp. S6]QUD86603.1 response regulator [Caulobacter sp. S6]